MDASVVTRSEAFRRVAQLCASSALMAICGCLPWISAEDRDNPYDPATSSAIGDSNAGGGDAGGDDAGGDDAGGGDAGGGDAGDDNVAGDSNPGDDFNRLPSLEAYVKASNIDTNDAFGSAVALSADGTTLAVGAPWEQSETYVINGDELDDSGDLVGAVYVYVKNNESWTKEAYIKAFNAGSYDEFGMMVAISADGNTLAVGAAGEGSGDREPDNDDAPAAGAVYVFLRVGNNWNQQAYIKADNPESVDSFGESIALSADGNRLAVGAPGEDGDGMGVNPSPNNGSNNSGAVYTFNRFDSQWTQDAYVKASNTHVEDWFGSAVALSGDGETLVVGAPMDQANFAGTAYVFLRSGDPPWEQQTYLTPSRADAGDGFAESLALSFNGNLLAVGSFREDGSAIGINGTESDNSAEDAGAVYLFSWNGTAWRQSFYIKASNTGSDDKFGGTIALSASGDRMAVGAYLEQSSAKGINGEQGNNQADSAGAVYVFEFIHEETWRQQAYVKASNTAANHMFGTAVALASVGTLLAVGSLDGSGDAGNADDTSATGAGAVHTYVIP